MAGVKNLLAILLLLPLAAFAPPPPSSPEGSDVDDFMQSAQQWAQENLDDSVLAVLQQVDRDRVRAFLVQLEDQFQGTNVYHLAALKETAAQILPVLQQFEETQPLAEWLQTRLDYLDTAAELQKQVTVTPSKPDTAALLVSPPAQIERSVWRNVVARRPIPPFAQTYLPDLKKAFADAGTPAQLVWLAEVESSFNPAARSPNGAAGLFQLTTDTARHEGLSTWPFDERLDPDKCARAAARQLHDLHRHYGDWRLTLAAYNAGRARVDKLLKKFGTHSFDAIARRLPAETQMYVPKVEAVIQLREGCDLETLKVPKA